MKLASVLDLGAAAPLWSSLCEARGQPVALDASAVERLGGQCLQILLAAREQWLRDEQPFAIVSPSAAFQEALRLVSAEDFPCAEACS